MAKKTFKGRALLPGKIEGKALVSHAAFNTSASYLNNMFAGETEEAICTDAANADLYQKELKGAVICTTQGVGSTLGGCVLMGMNELGVGPKALLYSCAVDSVSAAGLFMSDIWLEKRIVTIDMLGDEFLDAVQNGDPVVIHEDGSVDVG
jgi:predicted aconitase with swiveling domain